MIEILKSCFTEKYACFKGRALREEFWVFSLAVLVVGGALNTIGMSISNTVGIVVGVIVSLAVLLPSLGVTVRRLHDIGKGGGWIFILLIPLVGAIWFFVLMLKKGEQGSNRFGTKPAARM